MFWEINKIEAINRIEEGYDDKEEFKKSNYNPYVLTLIEEIKPKRLK